MFNGKEFKLFKSFNNYKKKNNEIRLIYKCKNYRHNEKFRIDTKQGAFCKATIEAVEKRLNKFKYTLKKDHSDECINHYNLKNFKKLKVIMINLNL